MRTHQRNSLWLRLRTAGAALLLAVSMLGISAPAPAQGVADVVSGAAGVPKIPALLPLKYDVPEAQPLPIDGVWTISTINRRIHIERGRAYAVDPWLHMFVLQVQTDMVVLRNFRRTAAGQYTADDLPLLGPATFRLQPDGNLAVTVQGALGPASYTLIRREPDNPSALDAEMTAMRAGPQPAPPSAPPPQPSPAPVATPAPTPAPPPSNGGNPLANCVKLGVDPATGDVVCMD